MIGIVRECQKIIRELRAKLARARTDQLARPQFTDHIRGVVDAYFRTDRPILVQRLVDESVFEALDGAMLQLLRYAQKGAGKRQFLGAVDRIQECWEDVELTVVRVCSGLTGGETPEPNDLERSIHQTLKRLCAPAAACYWQALTDLTAENRFSWRGTATECREALRHVLDVLATDDEVRAAPGFQQEEGLARPTMKQKVRFILKSRRKGESARQPVESAVDVVEEKFGSLVRSVYDRSSASLHSGATKQEVHSLKRFVETVLAELLEIKP